jgi:hypothetical protein
LPWLVKEQKITFSFSVKFGIPEKHLRIREMPNKTMEGRKKRRNRKRKDSEIDQSLDAGVALIREDEREMGKSLKKRRSPFEREHAFFASRHKKKWTL